MESNDDVINVRSRVIGGMLSRTSDITSRPAAHREATWVAAAIIKQLTRRRRKGGREVIALPTSVRDARPTDRQTAARARRHTNHRPRPRAQVVRITAPALVSQPYASPPIVLRRRDTMETPPIAYLYFLTTPGGCYSGINRLVKVYSCCCFAGS